MSGPSGPAVRIAVAGELGHPIVIGRGLASWLAGEVAGLGEPRRILMVADERVRAFADTLAAALAAAGHPTSTAWLVADERRKDLATLDAIWSAALAAGLGRRDAILAVGGGVVGDVAGFAAATFLRGIDLIAVPTTLLAMVDASTGGKCGINLPLPRGGVGKNLAGAFHAPRLVAIDPDALASLPEREFRSGLAECLKHAILDGEEHLAWLESGLPAILRRDPGTLERLIARSVSVKSAIVGRDPHERGERILLNLGHTFGHALETIPSLDLAHGEAVALGLIASSAIGGEAGFGDRVREAVRRLGLPTRLVTEVEPKAFLARVAFDKKGDASGPRVVLPRGPGRLEVCQATEEDLMRGLRAIAADSRG